MLRVCFGERGYAPNAALLGALIQSNLEGQADGVRQQYREAFHTRSTAYERESVLNQLNFLGEMLAWKGQDGLAAQVNKLRSELEK